MDESDSIANPDGLHQRAHWNDPDRCDGTNKIGPCPYKKIPGSNYCAVHGGASQLARNRADGKRAYLGAQWAAKIGVFAQDPELKKLNQEIGILRLLLHTVLSRCQNDNDLMLRSSTITDLVDKLGKLVINCNALDIKVGRMLDKEQLASFGDTVVQLVAEYIGDPEQLAEFTRKLTDAIVKTGTVADDTDRLLTGLAG